MRHDRTVLAGAVLGLVLAVLPGGCSGGGGGGSSTGRSLSNLAQETFSVGPGPVAVAAADLNGDGQFDIVTANRRGDSISVLLWTGDSAFGPAASFPAGASPTALVLTDLDGDGEIDAVVTNAAADTVSILAGVGDGAFLPPVAFAVGVTPSAVSVADLNGDGMADLAVANRGGDNFSILLRTTGISFGPRMDFGAGASPSGIAIGEFDGDLQPDVAVSNEDADTVTIQYGFNGGGFRERSDRGVGAFPTALTIGVPWIKPQAPMASTVPQLTKVVTADRDSNGCSVVESVVGSFAAPRNIAVGTRPVGVALLNKRFPDGVIQGYLVVANSGSNTVTIVVDPDQFTHVVGSNPVAVAVTEDVSGDGEPDILVANKGSDTVTLLH